MLPPQGGSTVPRNLQVMIAASLGFFFVTATTFTSLGYVLYLMVSDLGWSQAGAGLSFALLGLACGLSSPLPPLLMKWVGTRYTMFLGGLTLAAGFSLAAITHSISFFFLATALMGVGFSLVAPSPAVFLIATWFPNKSARMLGIYFMSGALGGVAGPLIVGSIFGLTGSWRLHWACMAAASVVLATVFLVTIRDAVTVTSTDQVKQAGARGAQKAIAESEWTVRQAMMSRAFMMIALAMVIVQATVTTIHAVLVMHVAKLGDGSAAGALAMSLLALSGTFAKGVSGALTERISPKTLLVSGLALQCAAVTLLCLTATPAWAIVFALLFGLGWGFAWLSAHVLLLRYFGASNVGDLTAMATMITTFAVLGPLAAGWTADNTGSFVPVFAAFAVMLGVVVVTTGLLLRRPRVGEVEQAGSADLAEAFAVPAE
jgi:cyanate permease